MRGLTFEPASHTYALDGRLEISVTGVLKAMGLIRLGDVPPAILERARKRGSAVHELIHYWNDGDLDEDSVDDGYRGYVDAWDRFCNSHAFQPLLSERRLASRRLRVCGTPDVIGLMDGYGALIDAKTGSPDDVAADLQLAGYEGLAREWAKDGDDGQLTAVLALPQFVRIRRVAVQLKRDGTFAVEHYQDPTDFSKFMTLANAYHIAEARRAELTLQDVA